MQLSIINIIKSKTRASVLKLFFDHSDQEFYLRQIEDLTGYSVGNIRREMSKLELEGLFLSRKIGNLKLFKLNKDYPLYAEIKNIVRKTIGMDSELKDVVDSFKDIDFAFIYGSFAENREKALSDIDVVIVGDVRPKEIKSLLFECQSRIGREINSIVYTKQEFLNKVKNKNHFVTALLTNKKIFIKGEENEFRRFAQIRKIRKT